MKSIRPAALILGLLALLAGSVPAASADEGSMTRPFVSGGRIRMDLSAGEYNILPGRTDQILIRWQSRSSRKAEVEIVTKGTDATIVTDGPSNNFRVTIEIPAVTDLHVDLSAGELRIKGIEGSKDVGAWAGEIDIDVPRPEDYKTVSASVTAGEIRAPAFKVAKDGLFRSFKADGPGKHTLRVRLTAGELRLRAADGAVDAGGASQKR